MLIEFELTIFYQGFTLVKSIVTCFRLAAFVSNKDEPGTARPHYYRWDGARGQALTMLSLYCPGPNPSGSIVHG